MDLECRVSTAGDWLHLNEGIYRLTADSFEDEATTWRRTDVSNPFVEGSWTVNALRENVMESLSIWVRGDRYTTTAQGVEILKTVFSQINYVLQAAFDGERRTYTCYVGDFSVNATRELRHAKVAKFTVQIPRHPAYVVDGI